MRSPPFIDTSSYRHFLAAANEQNEARRWKGAIKEPLRDDDTVLVVHLRSFEDRDGLLEHEPSAFFTTDHYRNYPTVLVRLARVRQALLKEILADAWRRAPPRKLLKEHGDI